MKLKSNLIDFSYWAGWNLLSVLPESVSRVIFDFVAAQVWRRKIKGVSQLELNLGRVTGLPTESFELRELSKQNIKNYLRYYREIFLLPKWSAKEIESKISVRNVEPLVEALKHGGLIIALPHMGNWDLAGAWAARYFGQLCTVAERLRPEGVFQKFLKMREEKGLTVIPLVGAGNPYELLKDNLLSGKPIALLADRDVSGSGLTNNFFGQPTKTPIGPALLAVETGLPLFTCATWYEGDKLIIDFDPQVNIDSSDSANSQPQQGRLAIRKAQEVSAVILSRFEKHIQAHPEAWHQLQPVWTDLKLKDK